MNVKSEHKVIMMCMGVIDGGRKLYEHEEIKREEMMKAIANLKNG